MFHSFGTLLRVTFILLAASTSGFAGEKIVFQIGWLPGGEYAPVYIGLQNGLFAKAGLDVIVQSGRGASDVVTKLATGVADIGLAGLPALLQASATSDVPVKAIYSIYTMQPDAIITTTGSGINTLKDLKGKRVGTGTLSSSNVVWPFLLRSNGLDPNDVTLIKTEPGALGPMLATGNVDALIYWSTSAPPLEQPLAEMHKSMKIIPWSEFGFDGYGYVLLASDKIIKNRPDTVRKFVQAYREAQAIAIADPKAAAESVKAAAPQIDVPLAQKQWEMAVPLITNQIAATEGQGAFNADRLAKTWEWTAKGQGLPIEKLDPAAALDQRFVH